MGHFSLPGDRLGVTIGDNVGHGVEAAAHVLLCNFVVRLLAAQGRSPDEVLTEISRFLLPRLSPHSAATLFLCVLPPDRRSLDYASAGHEPPILQPPTGSELTLNPTGPILGVYPSLSYRQRHVPLGPGSILALFTDGLVEARRCGTGDLLGPERFPQILGRHLLRKRAKTFYCSASASGGHFLKSANALQLAPGLKSAIWRMCPDARSFILLYSQSEAGGSPMQTSGQTVTNTSSETATVATRKIGPRDHVAYFLAGHSAPSGIYREIQTGREVHMEQAGILPATCDGRVAVYVRLPLGWAQIKREKGCA